LRKAKIKQKPLPRPLSTGEGVVGERPNTHAPSLVERGLRGEVFYYLYNQ
jgi:hypothetical protein